MNLSAIQPLTLKLPPLDRVRLTLAGCGGTGSHLATGLATLALTLREQGVECELRFFDPDRVELANVGRQLFALGEVRQPKAQLLAERLNVAFGLAIAAHIRRITRDDLLADHRAFHAVVGAVDNPAGRAAIADAVGASRGSLWWLDCGNENHSGQVALGNIANSNSMCHCAGLGFIDRLPAPHLVYPDLIAAPRARVDRAASCATATAAGEQGLMVNRMAAAWALALLNDLLVARAIHYFAVDFDLGWGGVRSRALDVATIADASGLSEQELLA